METSICIGRDGDADEALGRLGGTRFGRLCAGAPRPRRLRNLRSRLLRIGTSLLVLRALNLLLALGLLADIQRILVVVEEWQRYATALSNAAAQRGGRGNGSEERSLDWGRVDVDEPPPLDDPFLEALRLNELLVNSDAEAANRGGGRGRCARRTSVGGASDAFFVCADERYIRAATADSANNTAANTTSGTALAGNALLITGRRRGLIGDFERRLPVGGRWALFLPHEPGGTPPLLERLHGDVELHYMFVENDEGSEAERRGNHRFPVGDIVEAIADERYALAKLDLYSDGEPQAASGGVGDDNPLRQLAQLLTRLNTRQLLVTIRLAGYMDGNASSAVLLLNGWYRTVYRILTREHYALLGAQSSGGCDAAETSLAATRHRSTCEYRVTFLRMEGVAERFAYYGDVPTFGFGSPLEEKHRLERYLDMAAHRYPPRPYDEDNRCVELPPFSAPTAVPMMPCQRSAASSTRWKPTAIENFNRFTSARVRQCDTLVVAVTDKTVLESAVDAQPTFNAICGRVVLWCPRSGLAANVSSAVQWIGAGLSADAPREVVAEGGLHETWWPLERLVNQSALRSHESNVMLVDLAGAEWSDAEGGDASTHLLGGLLATGERCEPETLRHFEQIVMRIRMWTIEEATNYRRMYRHLLRFVECGGFQKVLSRRVDPSTWQLWFERRQFVHF